MKRIVCLVLMIVAATNFAQTKDPVKILDAVKHKFQRINDYQVDVNIHVDVNFIKMPDRKAKIFFKQPDKVKFQSEGFALLPKQGFNFSPVQLLKNDYSAIYVRSDFVNGKKLDVIKTIPNNDTSDVVLSTLWIDQANNVIRKVETIGKKSGNIAIDFEYGDNQTLPSEVKFAFNFEGGQVQAPAGGHEDQNNPAGRQMPRGPLKGTATLTYFDYKINQGIADSFFAEKKK